MNEPTNRRFGSFWVCTVCKDNPEFEHKDMMQHMSAVHNIDVKNTKGRKSMLMHLDGSDYFSSQYEWEINGMKFLQTTCSKRSKQDAMYWE